MKSFRSAFHIIFLCTILLIPSFVGATLIIQTGNVGSLDNENIVFNGTGLTSGPALTVTGRTNQTSLIVEFTSNENLTTPASGQARVEAVDGEFDYLFIELQDETKGFTNIIFNLDATDDDYVTLAFRDQFGTVFSGSYLLNSNGNNYFSVYSNDEQVMVSAEITADSEFINAISDIQQVRLGPTDITTPVPEPATMLLVGSGLLGLAGVGRKKFFNK